MCSPGANKEAEEIWERIPNNAREPAAAGRSDGQIQGMGDALWEPVSLLNPVGSDVVAEVHVPRSPLGDMPVQILGNLSGRWNSSPFLEQALKHLDVVFFPGLFQSQFVTLKTSASSHI